MFQRLSSTLKSLNIIFFVSLSLISSFFGKYLSNYLPVKDLLDVGCWPYIRLVYLYCVLSPAISSHSSSPPLSLPSSPPHALSPDPSSLPASPRPINQGRLSIPSQASIRPDSIAILICKRPPVHPGAFCGWGNKALTQGVCLHATMREKTQSGMESSE